MDIALLEEYCRKTERARVKLTGGMLETTSKRAEE